MTPDNEDTPFKKLNKDMKKHFAKLSSDISNFFQKDPAKASGADSSSKKDHKMKEAFAEFEQSSDATFEKLEADWIKRYDARMEKKQQAFQNRQTKRILREKIRHARMERNRKQRQAFLAVQREKWNASNKKMEEDIRTRQDRKVQRRNTRQENKVKNQRKWDRAALRRQKGVENAFKSVSRFGWQIQMRLVMILVPLLIVVILVIVLLRPLLQGII